MEESSDRSCPYLTSSNVDDHRDRDGVITSFFRRLYGTAVIGVNLIRQRGVAYLPPEKLHQLRDRRLRSIVSYAAATVPYYRDLFRERGIDPADIRTVDDLARAPETIFRKLRETRRPMVITVGGRPEVVLLSTELLPSKKTAIKAACELAATQAV